MKRALPALAVAALLPAVFIGAATGGFGGSGASGAVVCDGSGPTPAVQQFREAVFRAFPDLRTLGICNVRYIDGTEVWSQHAFCNAEDYTRPGAPASLGPVIAWIEEHREVYAVNNVITYAEDGLQHVLHVDFHPKREGDPHEARPCQAGELEAMVLSHPRISLRPEASEDVAAGKVDARVLQVLLVLAEMHDLGPVGPFITGHDYYVRGTKIPSNHAFGRAVDIAVIDGRAVSAQNAAAAHAMQMVLALPDEVLPDELGGPWDLPHPDVAVFTEDHGDHIHVGWDA